MKSHIGVNARYTFVTAAGLISGTVTSINRDERTYELTNVYFRSNMAEVDEIPFCVINEQNIIALTPAIDPKPQ